MARGERGNKFKIIIIIVTGLLIGKYDMNYKCLPCWPAIEYMKELKLNNNSKLVFLFFIYSPNTSDDIVESGMHFKQILTWLP